MYFYSFLKHDMSFKPESKITIKESSVEPEIFGIFQHKVELIPHFTRITEVRHILFDVLALWKTKAQVIKIHEKFLFSLTIG